MTLMEYRQLGNSGVRVSAIGLGTNQFGGKVDQAGVNNIIDAALDLGVNLIDTADVYAMRWKRRWASPCKANGIASCWRRRFWRHGRGDERHRQSALPHHERGGSQPAPPQV